jgi:hypothetical protein
MFSFSPRKEGGLLEMENLRGLDDLEFADIGQKVAGVCVWVVVDSHIGCCSRRDAGVSSEQ